MKEPAQALNASSCRYKSDDTSLLNFFVSFVTWSCKSQPDSVISCSGNKNEKSPVRSCRDSKRVCNCIMQVSTTGKNFYSESIARSFQSTVVREFFKKPFLGPDARALECGFSAPFCSCALSCLTSVVEFQIAPQLRIEINSFLQKCSCC